jgi:hypothetical protein
MIAIHQIKLRQSWPNYVGPPPSKPLLDLVELALGDLSLGHIIFKALLAISSTWPSRDIASHMLFTHKATFFM